MASPGRVDVCPEDARTYTYTHTVETSLRIMPDAQQGDQSKR